MKQSQCIVISNTGAMPGANLMWLEAPDVADGAEPGQFVTVPCDDLVLRRPFSIHQVASKRIAILFAIRGEGTSWLSRRQRGDEVDVLGSLGNGFSVESGSTNLLLVAGGIGIAPLVFLAQRASQHHPVTLIYGADTASQLCPCAVEKGAGGGEKWNSLLALPDSVRLALVTEDGSLGRKGLVTDVVPDFLDWADQVYACGPLDMYRAMAEMDCFPVERCQVSLELRLGCGVGACYGCTIATRKGLKRVCCDGPVFTMGDILWEEVKI